VVVAMVGIVGPHVSGLDTFVIQSPPDLAALFAVGILAAGIVGAGRAWRAWPWPALALALAAPVLALIAWRGSVWTLDHLFWVDLMLGPAIACLLAGLATGRPAGLVRVLDARPLRSLGLSSYSLYLTHGPIVVVVYEEVVAGRVRQGVPAFLVTLALVLPMTIAFARIFGAIFETRFRAALLVALESRRERVAQQHHVAQLADLGQLRPPLRVPGEEAVAHEPRPPRVSDEDGRDDELELVGEVLGEELGVHHPAALDHQPLHPAVAEIL
jgi:peptidoglycan/LPS O-acetylase OafA/YrhL